MIKNWKSQRWQTLLNFNSKRRLLITGAYVESWVDAAPVFADAYRPKGPLTHRRCASHQEVSDGLCVAAGTPLQNDLMELWSLMHFLMPQVFSSHAQFKVPSCAFSLQQSRLFQR